MKREKRESESEREKNDSSRRRCVSCGLNFGPDKAPTMVDKASKGKKEEVVTREYTINLHKCMHGCTFKKKALKAIKEIKKFA